MFITFFKHKIKSEEKCPTKTKTTTLLIKKLKEHAKFEETLQ